MKTLLLAWHSRTGLARAMAEAVAAGAEAEVPVRLLPVEAVTPAALLAADGYVFAAPENLGALSGAMKEMLDRCYYPVLEQLNGRPCAVLISAGTDGTGALRQLRRVLTGWRLREVAEPILLRSGAQTPEAIAAPKLLAPEDAARCRELGAALGAGLAMGVF